MHAGEYTILGECTVHPPEPEYTVCGNFFRDTKLSPAWTTTKHFTHHIQVSFFLFFLFPFTTTATSTCRLREYNDFGRTTFGSHFK